MFKLSFVLTALDKKGQEIMQLKIEASYKDTCNLLDEEGFLIKDFRESDTYIQNLDLLKRFTIDDEVKEYVFCGVVVEEVEGEW